MSTRRVVALAFAASLTMLAAASYLTLRRVQAPVFAVQRADPAMALPASPSAPQDESSCLAHELDANTRAWCLWSLVTQSVEYQNHLQPRWTKWAQKPAEGLGSYPCTDAVGIEKVKDEASVFQNDFLFTEGGQTGAPLQKRKRDTGQSLGTVYFNPAAIHEICELIGTGAGSVAARMDAAAGPPPAARPSLGAARGKYPVIVKAFWVELRNYGTHVDFQVWDSRQRPQPGSYNREQLWPWVGMSAGKLCDLLSPLRYAGVRATIPQSCFHSVELEATQARQTPVDQHFGTDVGRGSTFLLLAVNISAKVGNKWTWQTFNWDAQLAGKPSQSPYKLSRPEWAYFRMSSAPAGSGAIYSPYLEAELDHPQSSNCSRCHANAVYYRGPATPAGPRGAAGCMYDEFSIGSTSDPLRFAEKCGVTASRAADSIWSLANSNVAEKISISVSPLH